MNLRNYKLGAVASGGGSLFFSDILTAGGASEFLLFADIPYATESLDAYVGKMLNKYCSEGAARQMAVAAEQKAASLGHKAIGMGITCSLSKGENERAGREHKFYVALCYGTEVVVLEWKTSSQIYSRLQEELLVADYCKSFLEDFINDLEVLRRYQKGMDFSIKNDVNSLFSLKYTQPTDQYRMIHYLASEGSVSVVDSDVNVRMRKAKGEVCIYSGSFNPFHAGHEAILKECESAFGKDNVFLELSIANFEKPPLDALETQKRVRGMLKHSRNVIVTDKPLLDEKYLLLNGQTSADVVFAVGADTYHRYIPTKETFDYKFFVFPREGLEYDLTHPRIHPKVLDFNFEPVSISSTEIRNGKTKKSN